MLLNIRTFGHFRWFIRKLRKSINRTIPWHFVLFWMFEHIDICQSERTCSTFHPYTETKIKVEPKVLHVWNNGFENKFNRSIDEKEI